MSRYYSDDQKAEIKQSLIEWISKGETLREFCRQEGMPDHTSIYDWEKDDEEFAHRLARARDIGQEQMLQECKQICDTPVTAEELEFDEAGLLKKRTVKDALAHRKLQIETRLKLLAVWNPRKYGPKMDHTSSDGSATPKFNVSIDLSE